MVAAQNITLERPRMGVQRILLVEDDEDVGELFASVLRGEGYDVDVAGTVAMAWAHLDAHSYALAIVDWKLPMETAQASPTAPQSWAPKPS